MAKILKINEMKNEEKRKIEFTIDDLKDSSLINIKRKDDFYQGTFQAAKDLKYAQIFEFDGDEYAICDVYLKKAEHKYPFEFGYVVYKNGEIEYVIGIYEPHGFNVNEKRGLISVYGHEELITLWLDNGEWDRKYTH